MDDLLAFLAARLDESGQRMRRLLAEVQHADLACKDPKLLGRVIPGWSLWPEVEQALVERLAEVAAKRAVLDAYAEAEHLQRVGWDNDEPSKYEYMAREEALEKVVRLLAQPYAGRPGWREEWRA